MSYNGSWYRVGFLRILKTKIMDIKDLIEKAFAVGHTIGYGNTENHYKPEFERWWNDEKTQEQVKNCAIPLVSNSLDLRELERKLDEALGKETRETLTEWLKQQRE